MPMIAIREMKYLAIIMACTFCLLAGCSDTRSQAGTYSEESGKAEEFLASHKGYEEFRVWATSSGYEVRKDNVLRFEKRLTSDLLVREYITIILTVDAAHGTISDYKIRDDLISL